MSGELEVMSGGELLIRSPRYLRLVQVALNRVVKTASRDGIGPSPALRELLDATVAASKRADGMAAYRCAVEAQPLEVMSDELTTTQAAQQLGISPRAVRGLCERGTLDATQRKGQWLISADAVLDQIARNREK